MLQSRALFGMEKMIGGVVEFFVTSAVPKNLRRALDAAGALLDREARQAKP